MRNKETGELELVVDNKRLLLIGVVLLAVAFAMGYVVGRNSPLSTKLSTVTTASKAPASPDVQPQPESRPASAGTSQAAKPVTRPFPPTEAPRVAATPPAEAQPPPTTQPARHASEPVAPAPRVAEPVAGSYWQVTAQASWSSAEAIHQTLKDQGFPVLIRPGPGNLTVVWVGPYTDGESLARAKKRLEDAGLTPTKRP